MSKRLSLLESGQKKCGELLSKYPSNAACLSISRQIEYLVALELGAHSDRSLLKNITIGVLTAREIEALDHDAAEVFHQIAGASRLMLQ